MRSKDNLLLILGNDFEHENKTRDIPELLKLKKLPPDKNILQTLHKYYKSHLNATNIPRQMSITHTNENKTFSGIKKQKL